MTGGRRRGRTHSPKLTARRRHGLRRSQFAWPAKRKYPDDTRGRAIAAKGRAVQQYKRGNISRSREQSIIRNANRALRHFHHPMRRS